jgi:glycosyltransferase involved in cell wall biosynthesis
MRRVLLVQPSLQPPGGGNGVAAWILQALAPLHRVTVLTWRPLEVDSIDRFFGTSLGSLTFDRLIVPPMWRAIPDHLPVPAALMRSALLMRYARRVAQDFEVIVGVHNEADYGRRGIQYVHYPTYLRPRPQVDLRWYHRPKPVLRAYYALADRLAGFSLERMKSNLTLANSDWTATQIERSLGIKAQTLYPPVFDPTSPKPWEERRLGFLAIGRISPEKDYERVIRILARVRVSHPTLTLTIIGTADRQVSGYYGRLRTNAASLGSWIEFREDLAREEIATLMASHRYGIHGMREEHFGMAPAEMVRSGMIVWVPKGGGQVEIVGNEPALVFESDHGAVDSIARVLASSSEQQRLRTHLAARGQLFGTTRFVDAVRAIVSAFRE